MEDQYTVKFQEEVYPKVFEEVAEQTFRLFSQNEKHIAKEWKSRLDVHMDQIVYMQKQGIIERVAQTDISFLYSSINTGTQFRVDSYPQGGRIYASSLYTTMLDGSWLTKAVEPMGNKLAKYASQEGIRQYIRPAYIETLKLRAIRSLLAIMVARFKYTIPFIIDTKRFAKMKKEDSYLICMGEYMDWQNVLYANLPSVDIFNCDEGTNLRFRSFLAIYYQNKQFAQLDLEHAVFIDCTFQNVVIEECDMNDCLFDGCIFENVQFVTTKLAGSTFKKCEMSHVTWLCATFTMDQIEGQEQGYFEPTVFERCDFIGCSFEGCNIDRCITDNCAFKE